MSPSTHEGDLARRYVLNQLPEDQRERVEERLMTDRDLAEELDLAEEELADEYAAGLLQAAEKAGFESLLSVNPELGRRVAFARALRRYVSGASVRQAEVPARSWRAIVNLVGTQPAGFRLALAASCLVIVLGGGWLIFETASLRQRLEESVARQSEVDRDRAGLAAELAEAKARREDAESRLAAARAAGFGSRFVALVLQPGLLRGAGEMPQVTLSPEMDGIRLELAIEVAPMPVYDAVLETPEGTRIWSRSGLFEQETARGRAVVVDLPRAVLATQDYVVRLTGAGPDGRPQRAGTYTFRVVSR